jgi:hypothetical protein
VSWRARIRRAELRCPVHVDAPRLASELAEMTLATVGIDAGPLKGVRVSTLAKAIAAAGFDAAAGLAAVIQAIETKAGSPGRKE